MDPCPITVWGGGGGGVGGNSGNVRKNAFVSSGKCPYKITSV